MSCILTGVHIPQFGTPWHGVLGTSPVKSYYLQKSNWSSPMYTCIPMRKGHVHIMHRHASILPCIHANRNVLLYSEVHSQIVDTPAKTTRSCLPTRIRCVCPCTQTYPHFPNTRFWTHASWILAIRATWTQLPQFGMSPEEHETKTFDAAEKQEPAYSLDSALGNKHNSALRLSTWHCCTTSAPLISRCIYKPSFFASAIHCNDINHKEAVSPSQRCDGRCYRN